MKKMVCIMSLVLIVKSGFSQTWDEWFRQKKTQIKYLQKQIAALQVYIDAAQKGYAIYQDGLGFIGDLKDGDLRLHKDYFSSLSHVKGVIASTEETREIIQWKKAIYFLQQHILKTGNARYDGYVTSVFASLMNKVQDCGKETRLLTTDGHYQLTDKQRMEQVNKQHALMQEYYGFAKWMQSQVASVRHGQRQDRGDASGLQLLMDIK